MKTYLPESVLMALSKSSLEARSACILASVVVVVGGVGTKGTVSVFSREARMIEERGIGLVYVYLARSLHVRC